jgi:micrococcal nuclease|tara:strand:+ start:182 stop:598 length:417 start_codon:yes stop_codon:yes gene_type:complete
MKLTNKKNIKQEYIFKAKVVRVIDGDTIDIDIPMGFGITKTKQRCRSHGIDTPESRINTRRQPERIREKEMGLEGKARMKVLCGKEVYIESLDGGKLDKYGRLLINLYTLDGINISATLINEGLAIKYDGGRKKHVWV